MAALEALREAFARSESLATLAPRLANLNIWIAKETPLDRSQELQWASEGLEHARRNCRPGSLTRVGRRDRRRQEAAEARYASVPAAQGHREERPAEHAGTLAYRDQPSDAVAERRHELGMRAAITQPADVVAIIGLVPTTSPEATRSLIRSAGLIEAYREEWGYRRSVSGNGLAMPARRRPGRCRSHHGDRRPVAGPQRPTEHRPRD